MPRVDVTLNGRSYLIGCEDGQEARLRQLANYLDGQLRAIAGRAPTAGEAQALAMGALLVTDQLFDLKAEYDALAADVRNGAAPGEANGTSQAEEDVMVAAVDHLAKRIGDIAAKLDRA
ncbi:cell division protein ZapA [Skermanella sp. TT6]|uniref:Cell division protein ZapA n=1 Tax=Skermanella cutis TaxID=2775420 RepID=A0ABX7B009_9PROT|nr:cell division protein ZapA [Skermanella sp. TT6]QQP87491.1 cell division protein ZapA [Skermanella sp. TT6]